MKQRIVMVLSIVALLLPGAARAQDKWTCDNGPKDVLNAAQAAFDKGDLTQALVLAKTTEQVCQTANPLRAGQGSILRAQIERAQRSTVTPTSQASTDQQQLNDLYDQGNAAIQRQNYADALTAFEAMLGMARRLGDRKAEESALYNLGGTYLSWGQYQQALDYLMQSLAIVRAMHYDDLEASVLNSIGLTYNFQSQYTKALDNFNQALAVNRKLGDHTEEAASLLNIGQTYTSLGQFTLALDSLNRSLAISQQLDDAEEIRKCLASIGDVYRRQGDYAKAIDTFTQVLTQSRTVDDRAGEESALQLLGSVYQQEGQYPRAIDSYNQALALAKSLGNDDRQGNILSDIGEVYLWQQHYPEALSALMDGLNLLRKTGNLDGQASTLNLIAEVYLHQNDLTNAKAAAAAGLDLARVTKNPVAEAVLLGITGKVTRELGRVDESLTDFNQALDIEQKIGDPFAESLLLYERGTTYEMLGKSDLAIADLQAAIKFTENQLDAAALDSSIAALSREEQNSWVYSRLAELLIKKGDVSGALSYLERGRAILARSQISSRGVSFGSVQDASLLEREQTLNAALSAAQKTLDGLSRDPSASATDIQKAQTTLNQARQDYEQNLAAMRINGGFAAGQVSSKVAPLERIQAVIPTDTTLLFYAIGPNNSLVMLITRDNLDGVLLNATSQQIQEQVAAFSSDPHANVAALSKLYDLVVAPAKSKLTTKHLLIVPDGALNYVPFAALQSPSGRYLIDDYAVSMIPSATTLVLLNDRQSQNTTKLTSPGLVLAQSSAPGLPTLNNARAEASAIAKVLGVEPILNATEADLRNKVKGSQVLTISAHAELNPTAPLFSSIDLKADSQSSGRFEARSIYELDLSATDLVVLSGCNTASGGDGEDFGVLTRAFFGAGASRVVASLWSVDDAATAFLITSYMSARVISVNEADALRTAMLATRAKYPEPYFWASFVLTGLPIAANPKGSPSSSTAAPTLAATAPATVPITPTPKSINNLSAGGSVAPHKK